MKIAIYSTDGEGFYLAPVANKTLLDGVTKVWLFDLYEILDRGATREDAEAFLAGFVKGLELSKETESDYASISYG